MPGRIPLISFPITTTGYKRLSTEGLSNRFSTSRETITMSSPLPSTDLEEKKQKVDDKVDSVEKRAVQNKTKIFTNFPKNSTSSENYDNSDTS
ncbi:unnamed protein product [Auanema sp. JU1783]|nr:unnamed protein product [Auanema sp. JU1783]